MDYGENNKPSPTTTEAKRLGPIEVKVIMLHKMVSTENGKHLQSQDSNLPQDRLEPRELDLPIGPFRPIKNIDPPAIVEEYKEYKDVNY
jgi:hypothetical protein